MENKKSRLKDSKNVNRKENKLYFDDKLINSDRDLTDIIFANLIVIFAIFISAFIPFISLALPYLVLIYFEVGLLGFIYKCENGDKYHYEDIFVSIKLYIKTFCVFVIKMFLILFWSCLFIIPGIITMLNYSFTPLIIFESEKLDTKGILSLSKEMTKGFRWNIFFYELLALATMCVAMTFMFLIILFFDVFLVVPSFYYIIFVILAGILDIVLVGIPMIEIAIVDSFIDAKKSKIAKLG